MAVFGVNHKNSSPDPNSVDVLIQGDPGLKSNNDNTFSLTSNGHVNYRGEIPKGPFEPIVAIIYKGDRDQFGIKGARVSIYPAGGRKFKKQL